jgi:hypothetical protein
MCRSVTAGSAQFERSTANNTTGVPTWLATLLAEQHFYRFEPVYFLGPGKKKQGWMCNNLIALLLQIKASGSWLQRGAQRVSSSGGHTLSAFCKFVLCPSKVLLWPSLGQGCRIHSHLSQD